MAPLLRAAGACELLDAPAPLSEIEANLRELARLNRVFGGTWLVLTHVARLLERTPSDQPLTVLDVGTGGADLPVALVRWARLCGRPIRVLALDRSGDILTIARRLVSSYPEILFVRGDGLRLPLRTGGIDVALASLTLHHLEPSEAPVLLSELHRVARLGFVVNDLIRSRSAYCLVWLATRLFTRSRMIRHDGPLSVRRAYAPAEIVELARRAGLTRIQVFRYPWLSRLAVVGVKG